MYKHEQEPFYGSGSPINNATICLTKKRTKMEGGNFQLIIPQVVKKKEKKRIKSNNKTQTIFLFIMYVSTQIVAKNVLFTYAI